MAISLVDSNSVSEWPSPETELEPSAIRAEEIDRALRARLAQSLNYLADVSAAGPGPSLDLKELSAQLQSHDPVSPWVFCLYSKLVAELAKNPRGDVATCYKDLVRAAATPARVGVVPLRDPGFERRWWVHLQTVLDTDRERPFVPKAPAEEDFCRCKSDVVGAIELLEHADPVWHAELATLLRMIVLASPASEERADGFNGASTFFFWAGAVLNAKAKRTPISMIDVLVHESSHVLLFGLSVESPLMRNSGAERYASPVRTDARPLEGIFHACFVTTCVHRVLSRMLDYGELDAEQKAQAMQRRTYNGNAARSSLDLVERHMDATEVGLRILDALRTYWAKSN